MGSRGSPKVLTTATSDSLTWKKSEYTSSTHRMTAATAIVNTCFWPSRSIVAFLFSGSEAFVFKVYAGRRQGQPVHQVEAEHLVIHVVRGDQVLADVAL